MAQILPITAKPKSFIDDCVKQMDDCVIDHLSEQLHICGELVCGILEDTTEKVFSFGDGPSQQGRIIELSWRKADMPNARAGDEVIYKGERFKIKKGYPIDQRDCWLMAELSTCETC